MDKLFFQALEEAEKLASRHGGGSSVMTYWHFYEAQWFAVASWSDNYYVRGESEGSPTDALMDLLDKLREEVREATS